MNFPRSCSVQLLFQNVNYPILTGMFWNFTEYCRVTKVHIKFIIISYNEKELFKLQISSLQKPKCLVCFLMKNHCVIYIATSYFKLVFIPI